MVSSPFEVHKLFFPYCASVKNEFQPLAICEIEGASAQIEPVEVNDTKTLDELRERLSCKVCFKKEVSVRFNCKHIVSCNNCSLKLNACPICRCIINERIDVILGVDRLTYPQLDLPTT